ncbi:class I SAM-dependent methyltransferase [Catelliglobosispora koreensis]|uniref:class I SAM-dependent methyltransferase n=1 Tax=Catelliglobosispora koreensis TaxID=129052 RepID=UPI000368DEB4|nr:class I SAM-dependent methyltransferase [Catelliglobosispora koreensis]
MTPAYEEVIASLKDSYDADAATRDGQAKEPWKLAERESFLRRLTKGQKLLEIGAGTGHDSYFFQRNGLSVTATDLSPEMVARCRAKGLDAHVMDFLSLDFPPESFDAVWALNCLLHVPNKDLPRVLTAIHDLLKPGGLFFIGVYGGEAHEGIHDNDQAVPKRFFSRRTDEQLKAFVSECFEVVDFHPVTSGEYRIQVLIARR